MNLKERLEKLVDADKTGRYNSEPLDPAECRKVLALLAAAKECLSLDIRDNLIVAVRDMEAE